MSTSARIASVLEATECPWIEPEDFRAELKVIAETKRPTGIPTFDKAMNGGLPGKVIVLANGKAGSTKSALLNQLGLDRARKTGGKFYVYSPDQGGTQPVGRFAEKFGDTVTDENAFESFAAEMRALLRVIDERRSGVSLEKFRDAVFAAGDAAAVLFDTPQTVITADDDEGERARVDAAMEIGRQIADRLLVPVFVASHANRAATAARRKEDRTDGLSAGLGSSKLEHRAQVVLFLEKIDRPDGRTEIDVEIKKVSFGISGLRLRLELHPSSWKLIEIDRHAAEAQEEAEKEAAATRKKDEEREKVRAQRRELIRSLIRTANDPKVGVTHSFIREKWEAKANTLPVTLSAMVDDGEIEECRGPAPKTGGKAPKAYRFPQPKPADPQPDLPLAEKQRVSP